MTAKALAAATTAALIEVQGGRRYCASCRCLRPADSFTHKRGNRCGVIRCGVCADRAALIRQKAGQT